MKLGQYNSSSQIESMAISLRSSLDDCLKLQDWSFLSILNYLDWCLVERSKVIELRDDLQNFAGHYDQILMCLNTERQLKKMREEAQTQLTDSAEKLGVTGRRKRNPRVIVQQISNQGSAEVAALYAQMINALSQAIQATAQAILEHNNAVRQLDIKYRDQFIKDQWVRKGFFYPEEIHL